MSLPAVLLSNAAVTVATSGASAVWWLAARTRLARDTVFRAEAERVRPTREAEFEAAAMRRGAQLASRDVAQAAIRIAVETDQVTGDQAIGLSRDIARLIDQDLQYPGQIKVTVIRETPAVEYAR